MTDMAELIGNPTRFGVVEAVWLCGHHGIPADPENLEWYVGRFWDEGVGDPITVEDTRQYIAAALDSGEITMQVSPDLTTTFVLSAETASAVARRYAYWESQRTQALHTDIHRAVLFAWDEWTAGTEGEWPARADLVAAVVKHCDACPDMAEEMVNLTIASGVLTLCLHPCDKDDYPEVGRALAVLRPHWRLRPTER